MDFSFLNKKNSTSQADISINTVLSYFFDIIKFLFIASNLMLGISLIVYCSSIDVNISQVVYDIGFLGFEIEAVFYAIYFFIPLSLTVIFTICLHNIRLLWAMSLKRRKRARYITLSLFASAVMIVSFFLCVKMYCTILAEIFDFSKGYTLLSYLVLSVLFFCLLSAVYYLYLKNKFTLIVCLALLVIVGAFIYEPISEFYLQKSGIIPEKEKAYLFVGDKENSLAIKEAFDIARNKGALDFFSKEKLPFLKDTHGHYCNNNKVFRPMIFAGNYIYFKEYNFFIRVKRDDIFEVGGCKPLNTSLLSLTVHDQTHDAHDMFPINNTLNITLWDAMTESTQLQ